MKSLSSRAAIKNLSRLDHVAKWVSGGTSPEGNSDLFEPEDGAGRAYKASPAPAVFPKFKLPANPRIFATGSCFAREIEHALHHQGLTVLSWTPDLGVSNEHFHRYTTHAIINDFRFALEDSWSEDNLVAVADKWSDYSGHNLFDTREEAIASRRGIIDRHKRIVDADVLFITLGLVEAWYDTQTGTYLNIPPSVQFLGGRFELRVTDFAENLASVQSFIALLRQHRPELKIIITVSPVPLRESFSGQDIVVANAYSKAVLRAVAQEVAQDDPLIDYFPSYEMVTLADPNAAWLADYRHVQRPFVDQIITRFTQAYLTEGGTSDTA